MTLKDFSQRVYSAMAGYHMSTGIEAKPTAIVVNILDWHDIEMEAVGLVAGAVTPISYRGIPVATDPRRPRGTIALTWILEA